MYEAVITSWSEDSATIRHPGIGTLFFYKKDNPKFGFTGDLKGVKVNYGIEENDDKSPKVVNVTRVT